MTFRRDQDSRDQDSLLKIGTSCSVCKKKFFCFLSIFLFVVFVALFGAFVINLKVFAPPPQRYPYYPPPPQRSDHVWDDEDDLTKETGEGSGGLFHGSGAGWYSG